MFDPSAARARLDRLWALAAQQGIERDANRVFLDEIVSDRMQLLSGLQVLRDELQFASVPARLDREHVAADLTQPSVVTTLAHTNCGDRIHQNETENYRRVVASRFATLSELGTLKPEAFHPTGGGTEDGATLAHVTWAHALDDTLRARIYDGNARSFVLCGFDIKTHVGRDGNEGDFGRTRESRWREPRAACGAIVGMLGHFNPANDVHRRLRGDLGEESYAFLTREHVRTPDGVDLNPVIAAAIIAIRGLHETANALRSEMDERGLAHLTASVTVNIPDTPDTMLYLARATVFDGELALQGLGLDAARYAGTLQDDHLRLTYDGRSTTFPITREPYSVRVRAVARDEYA